MSSFSPPIDVQNANILIIDPQVDFHEGGNLAVFGATADSERISKFIEKNANKLKKIYVSLDTHTKNHIGHPGYWESVEDKSEPSAWTVFSFENDKIMGTMGTVKKEYTPKNKELLDWTKEYVKTIKRYGKGPALIWPTHCLEYSSGHDVTEVLKKVLNSDSVKDKVEYHIKGQNEATEMYSIFKAEIPVENEINDGNKTEYYSGDHELKDSSKIKTNTDKEDGAYLNTTFNEALYEELTKYNSPILICGEALSHCVNWSLRDLVNKILNDKIYGYVNNEVLIEGQVILLLNASSRVSGFEKNVKELLNYCKSKNVTIRYLLNGDMIIDPPPKFLLNYKKIDPVWKPIWKGGKTKKRRNNKNNRKSRKHRNSRKHY